MLGKKSRRGILVDTKETAAELQKQYQIKANSGDDRARALSGGNQQKVILPREIGSNPEVLIASQPTRGLDIGAAEYVRKQILETRNQGAAVLVISADLEEILQLSDRIAVIYGGKLISILIMAFGSSIAFCAKLWNIGAGGQFIMSSIATTAVGRNRRLAQEQVQRQ